MSQRSPSMGALTAEPSCTIAPTIDPPNRLHATLDQEHFYPSLDLALDAISNAGRDLGSPE